MRSKFLILLSLVLFSSSAFAQELVSTEIKKTEETTITVVAPKKIENEINNAIIQIYFTRNFIRYTALFYLFFRRVFYSFRVTGTQRYSASRCSREGELPRRGKRDWPGPRLRCIKELWHTDKVYHSSFCLESLTCCRPVPHAWTPAPFPHSRRKRRPSEPYPAW